jgi:hypothetical protein
VGNIGTHYFRRTVRLAIVLALAVVVTPRAVAVEGQPVAPQKQPQYDLEIVIDNATRHATIHERVTWTNTSKTPTDQLAFNFYPHFSVPAGEALLFAKTLELLRLQPSLGIDRDGKMGNVTSAHLVAAGGPPVALPYSYDENNTTTLRFKLPHAVQPGQTVVVDLVCDVRLPNKQGRWGHYEGVTYLTNAVPLLAVHGDDGWKPMPFVPWHQPWYNEAGMFRASVTVDAAESVACSAATKRKPSSRTARRGRVRAVRRRDFAVLASAGTRSS